MESNATFDLFGMVNKSTVGWIMHDHEYIVDVRDDSTAARICTTLNNSVFVNDTVERDISPSYDRPS